MKQIYKKIRDWLSDNIIGKRMRQQLKNREFTIISSDCTGGTVYHDLHKRFDTPTINLYMNAGDFVKFCKNLKEYVEKPLIERMDKNMDFPVGTLEDITIYFVHYKTFEEAREKWNVRKQRIHWENLYFIMNDRNDCSEKIIADFDRLNYKNKVIFTHKKYSSLKSSYYISGYDNKKEVGIMTKFLHPFSIKRNYDKFDWVKWLNGD